MAQDILELTMTELAKEQHTTSEKVDALSGQMKLLTEKVEQLTNKPVPKLPIIPTPDLTKLEILQAESTEQIKQFIQAAEKPVVKQFRLLLFPETNAEHYYKIVFGRLIPWMIGIIVCICLFELGKESIDAWSKVKVQEHDYEKYEDVLNQLDTSLNAFGRKKLHEAIKQTQKKE